jgi:NADH:ubiquinone oxidoreductase subunit 6 (subunit J)
VKTFINIPNLTVGYPISMGRFQLMWAEELIGLILIIASVVLAILVVELPDLLHSVVALCGMSITIGALFWLLSAPYPALFQILVYAGAVIVLFIAAIMLGGGIRAKS